MPSLLSSIEFRKNPQNLYSYKIININPIVLDLLRNVSLIILDAKHEKNVVKIFFLFTFKTFYLL